MAKFPIDIEVLRKLNAKTNCQFTDLGVDSNSGKVDRNSTMHQRGLNPRPF